ncbi:MAG: hypothetical protein M3Q10_13580 [Chloroflexota bacterium]|nr:hypothetical protein [Chloroflexota bacterium]
MSADASRNVLSRAFSPGTLLRPALISLAAVVVLGLLTPSWPVATLILIYGLAALAANLLLGYTGLLSMGQGVYFGVGGYIAGILSTELGFQLSTTLLLSAVLCAAVAAFIGAFAIRRTGIYFVMITFAFAENASHNWVTGPGAVTWS